MLASGLCHVLGSRGLGTSWAWWNHHFGFCLLGTGSCWSRPDALIWGHGAGAGADCGSGSKYEVSYVHTTSLRMQELPLSCCPQSLSPQPPGFLPVHGLDYFADNYFDISTPNMANDAIQNLANSVQCCLNQLTNLINHIKSQATPAAEAAADGQNPEIKSLHNNSSTEFLALKEDESMPSAPESMPDNTLLKDDLVVASEPSTPLAAAKKRHKRSREDIGTATEGTPPEKRSRNMTDGYYDRHEQSVLSDLMSFVSDIRRSMRNTKLEVEIARTKVTLTKRPAEADVLDGKIDNENDLGELPSPSYMSTSTGWFSTFVKN